MNGMLRGVAVSVVAMVVSQSAISAEAANWISCGNGPSPRVCVDYGKVIGATAGMVRDAQARQYCSRQGLNIMNVTWEDTGRFKGSSVGPNISDMTIQVQYKDPRTGRFGLTCMPVIRFPNFSDKTADLSLDKFNLLVGNERAGGAGPRMTRVTLREFLGNMRRYMTRSESWTGGRSSLLADRDTHVLVSAQACFLPIPKSGKATFNPVLFNYQSVSRDPAVLTILATREGTSVTVIDNKRDAFRAGRTWGQRLFHNAGGMRASLTGERMSDFIENGNRVTGGEGPNAAGQGGLNMVLLIQVPLKQKNPMRFESMTLCDSAGCAPEAAMRKRESDVEAAVIGHGEVEGPYTEIDGLDIERDPRFPVRVTVQFYKATSNGVVSDADVVDIAKQIRKVYADADYVGSLVTGGETGRPTEYDGNKVQPAGWWDNFWKRHHENTGSTREDTSEMLRKLYGVRR